MSSARRQVGHVGVAGDPWEAQSPCAEWTARDVVGHVIAVQYAILATVEGRRAPMNPMKDPGRHAGADPAAAWQEAHAALGAAIRSAEVLGRVVTTWRGEMSVDEMLGYNVGDTTVHTWDLARAVGADDTLDPDLVDASLRLYTAIADGMRAPGVFADAVIVDDSADAQTRLLAMVGRAAG